MEDRKKFHVELNNLAMPEIVFDDDIDDDDFDDTTNDEVDYNVAIPEVHVDKIKKKD